MTRFTNFCSRGAPRADLHRKTPSTMGHESLIQRRPSLSHPGGLKYFFQTYNPLLSITIHLDIYILSFHRPFHTQVTGKLIVPMSSWLCPLRVVYCLCLLWASTKIRRSRILMLQTCKVQLLNEVVFQLIIRKRTLRTDFFKLRDRFK